VKVRWS